MGLNKPRGEQGAETTEVEGLGGATTPGRRQPEKQAAQQSTDGPVSFQGFGSSRRPAASEFAAGTRDIARARATVLRHTGRTQERPPVVAAGAGAGTTAHQTGLRSAVPASAAGTAAQRALPMGGGQGLRGRESISAGKGDITAHVPALAETSSSSSLLLLLLQAAVVQGESGQRRKPTSL